MMRLVTGLAVLSLCGLPRMAAAQTATPIPKSGLATGAVAPPGTPVTRDADVSAALATKVDTTGGVLTAPQVRTGLQFLPLAGAGSTPQAGNTSQGIIPTIHVPPIGNPVDTLSALVLQGSMVSGSQREFLIDFGTFSATGAACSPNCDKVTLYTSMDALPGSGDVWAQNILVSREVGTAPQNTQGIELDIGNQAGDLAGTGKAETGINVTAVGAFLSTYGLTISGSTTQNAAAGVHTGVYVAGAQDQDFYVQDNATDVMLVAGTHAHGLNTVNATVGYPLTMGVEQSLLWIGGGPTRTFGYTKNLPGATGTGGLAYLAGPIDLFHVDDTGNARAAAGLYGNSLNTVGDVVAGGALNATGNVTGQNVVSRGLLILPQLTPTSSSAPCSTGTVEMDASYVYSCVATNTWRRAALTSF